MMILVSRNCVQSIQKYVHFRNGITHYLSRSQIEDHVTYLSSHVTPVVVATPNRLRRLITEGNLRLDDLKLVILDWYWRNKKFKQFHDIPEVSDNCTNTLI